MRLQHRQTQRSEEGFSLPTIVALGVVASLWMLGTASLVIPATYRLTAERANDLARASAEASLDWAVQQLNSPSTRQSIDGQSNVQVPATILSSSQLQGTVSVFDVPAPPNSYLYDPLADSNNSEAALPAGNGWRVIRATVTPINGAFSVRRTVQVILKPIYAQMRQQTQTVVAGPPTPLFTYSAFGRGAVGGNGNMVTNSYDSTQNPKPKTFQNTGADVGTNGTADLNGNVNIGGNLNAWSTPGNSGTVVTGGNNVTIHGNVDANGGVSGLSSQNVSGTITQNDNHAQQQFPAAPTAPSNAVDLGTISLSGNRTMTLTAGSYIVSSISITGNGQLMIDSSNGPVNIYVQGGGSAAGINIGGNGIMNGATPANLRIWYGGTGDTHIAGNGSFTGVIYAPNSNVSINGNGQEFGAVVGNSVNFNGNGTFHYDRSLSTNQQLMWNPPLTVTTYQNVNYLKYFQAVSWEER